MVEFDTEATLCFVFEEDEVLLIEKKRGPGEGLFNGPGGKLEEAETPVDCAVRETQEETHVKPENPEKVGELKFYFGEEPFMHVYIFKTDSYSGEPQETEEANPEWFNTDNLPYEDMWPDDKYWVPLMLEDKQFVGEFWFDEDGDEILDYELEENDWS